MRRLARGFVIVGALMVLLLGSVAAPAVAVDETPMVTISGTVLDGDPSDPYAVQYGSWDLTLHNAEVYPYFWTQQVRGYDPTFAVEVPAHGTYTAVLRAAATTPRQVWSLQTWYGDTPFESGATPIVVGDADVGGIDIPARAGGRVTGAIEGVSYHWAGDHHLSATALLLDPVTGSPAEWFTAVAGPGGVYELTGLPEGTYVVELFHGTYNYGVAAREHLPEFYPGVRDLDQAQRLAIVPGGLAEHVDATLEPWRYQTKRLAGEDRFATAVALSQSEFEHADVVYVANGLGWPDALSAGPAAARAGGPLLLTRPGTLPPATAAEIRRLQPAEIVIVGGAGVVGPAVESALKTLAPVRRVHGPDRYATSRAVLADSFPDAAPVVWVATGDGFADALSAGSAAAREDAPLLLVNPRAPGLDVATVALLEQKKVEHVSLAGGTGALSMKHEEAARALVGSAARYAGVDRYETSWRIAVTAGWPHPLARTRTAFLASGSDFPDALAAGPLSADGGGMVLLSRRECIPAATDRALRTLFADQPVVVGGPGVLSSALDHASVCLRD